MKCDDCAFLAGYEKTKMCESCVNFDKFVKNEGYCTLECNVCEEYLGGCDLDG